MAEATSPKLSPRRTRSMALGLHLIPERKLELALVSLKAIAKR